MYLPSMVPSHFSGCPEAYRGRLGALRHMLPVRAPGATSSVCVPRPRELSFPTSNSERPIWCASCPPGSLS